jgi:hypothetical protein
LDRLRSVCDYCLAQSKDMTRCQRPKHIDEESASARSLAHCLKERCGCRKVGFKAEEHDPPDFWFTIDGEVYAAEVTRIVTEKAYQAFCKRLAQSIRGSSPARGTLGGTYVLLIRRRPRLPKATSADWRALIKQATDFIEATREADAADEARLLEDDKGYLGIRKTSAHGAAVGEWRADAPRWEGEVQDELNQLIAAAVTEKRKKLEKKGVPARCPRIMLLLYDEYNYGDVEDAQKALLTVDGYDWYHSVFWAASSTDRTNELSPANPGRVGTFLYSVNGNWWNRPT